jgi:hypothetical protein
MFGLSKTSGPLSPTKSPRKGRRKTKCSLGLESLEGRQLMSILIAGRGHHGIGQQSHLSKAAAEIRKSLDASVFLTGTATGSWSSQMSIGMTTYTLSGSGVINPLQFVWVAATITHSNARLVDTGTVLLSSLTSASRPGTLTLTSVAVRGSLTDPGGEQFHYTMSGTGAYAGMTGSGAFQLVLTQTSPGQGQFTLTFNPATSSRA